MAIYIDFLPFYPTGLNCSHVFTFLARNPLRFADATFMTSCITPLQGQAFDYFSLLPLTLVTPFTGLLEYVSRTDGLCAWSGGGLPLSTSRLVSYHCLLVCQGWAVPCYLSLFGSPGLYWKCKPLPGISCGDIRSLLPWGCAPPPKMHYCHQWQSSTPPRNCRLTDSHTDFTSVLLVWRQDRVKALRFCSESGPTVLGKLRIL